MAEDAGLSAHARRSSAPAQRGREIPSSRPRPRARPSPFFLYSQMRRAEGLAAGLAASAERLFARSPTPLSHLPDKHHENSAAHTVIAAPAAGRVSTSSRAGRERERDLPSSSSPVPSCPTAAPAPPPSPPRTRPPAPTARRPAVRPCLSPLCQAACPPRSAHPHLAWPPIPGPPLPSRCAGPSRRAGLLPGPRPRAASGRGRAGWGRAAVAAV